MPLTNRKPFSSKLHHENDARAKETALQWLLATGHYRLDVPLWQQPEAFKSHDFTVTLVRSNKVVRVEVERKKVWTLSGQWQGWATVDIPARKLGSLADLFVMVNEPCNTVAVALMETVRRGKPITKDTIYTNGEQFLRIPVSEFRFYHRNDETWIRVKS